MLRRLSVVVPLVLVLALGCGTDHPEVRVATPGTVFARGGTGVIPQASVPFTVTNRGDQTIFLPACDGRAVVMVEKGVGGHWELYSGGFCILDSNQTPIAVRAGQSVTSHFDFVEAGRFRIRASYGTTTQNTSEGDALSNSFEVR